MYYSELGGGGDAWYQRVIHWVQQQAALEDQLMKQVHEELAQFFDVVNEREFHEIQEPVLLAPYLYKVKLGLTWRRSLLIFFLILAALAVAV